MSKQMKSAYFALRLKDSIAYFAEVVKTPMIVLVSLALLLCNTAAFAIMAIIASVATVAWCVFRLIAFLCNLRMHCLGYNEIELERMALA